MRSGADVVMVPELAVSGYPPEDLLFHSGMRLQVARVARRLKAEVRGITLIAGYPEYDGGRIFNSAIVIRDGAVLANHRKACLTELPGIRREALFHAGHGADGGRLSTASRRESWCARTFGSRSPRRQARACRRRGAAGDQRLALRGEQANAARASRSRARASQRRGSRWCSST